MGLSNKLLLAAKVKGGTAGHWQGDISCKNYGEIYEYDRSLWTGTLSPLLETVKPNIRISSLIIVVNSSTGMLTKASLSFSTEFKGLKRIIIHSNEAGEPYVIDNPQDYWNVDDDYSYNLYSEDLANWWYQNLPTGDPEGPVDPGGPWDPGDPGGPSGSSSLDFTFELEWYE